MNELNFTGNCIKGSRPILIFDASFDLEPSSRLMKEVLSLIFATPKGHPRSRPFVDHVFSFSLLDNKIWFRNYQIVEELISGSKTERTLVEIGPRFVLNPIRIIQGSFIGSVVWENPQFISPSALRAEAKRQIRLKIATRELKRQSHKDMLLKNPPVLDPLRTVFSDKEFEQALSDNISSSNDADVQEDDASLESFDTQDDDDNSDIDNEDASVDQSEISQERSDASKEE